MKNKLEERILRIEELILSSSGKRLDLPRYIQGCQNYTPGSLDCKFCIFSVASIAIWSDLKDDSFYGCAEEIRKIFPLPLGTWNKDFLNIDSLSEETYRKLLPAIVSFYDTNLIDEYYKNSQLELNRYWKTHEDNR